MIFLSDECNFHLKAKNLFCISYDICVTIRVFGHCDEKNHGNFTKLHRLVQIKHKLRVFNNAVCTW